MTLKWNFEDDKDDEDEGGTLENAWHYIFYDFLQNGDDYTFIKCLLHHFNLIFFSNFNKRDQISNETVIRD